MPAKYEPLKRRLESLRENTWRTDFAEIARVLGSSLPSSARRYPAWWSNDASQGRQSNSWLGADWRTEQVDLVRGQLTFVRQPAQSPQRPVSSSPRLNAVPGIDTTFLGKAPWRWDQANRVDSCLRFEWAPLGRVLLDAGGKLLFPTAPPKPGLYRFRVRAFENEERYVGEADDLRRRFQHYRTPGPTQATNIRLNERFSHALNHGAEIAVAIIVDDAWIRRDEAWEQADLALKAVRRLFESLALVAEDDTLVTSLNR